jgi:glucose-1-phosphate adenylyltransferase
MSVGRAVTTSGQPVAVVLAACCGEHGKRCTDARGHDAAAPCLRRSLDWALANCIGSGLRRIAVLAGAAVRSLREHVGHHWSLYPPAAEQFIVVWPDDAACAGEGDAVLLRRHWPALDAAGPAHVLVIAGQPLYRMDYRPLLEAHVDRGGGATVGCRAIPPEGAAGHGIVSLDGRGRITRLDERPTRPGELDEGRGAALASLGAYVFDRDLLADCLAVDADNPTSGHDFRDDILPLLVRAQTIAPFRYGGAQLGRQSVAAAREI